MLSIPVNGAIAIAQDARGAFAGIDGALLGNARLIVAMLEANDNAEVPASDVQRVLQAAHDSAGHVLAGRADMVRAVGLLQAIRRRSNLNETGLGCPGEMPVTGRFADRSPRLVPATR